jgi:hypothetical protein
MDVWMDRYLDEDMGMIFLKVNSVASKTHTDRACIDEQIDAW